MILLEQRAVADASETEAVKRSQRNRLADIGQ